MNSYRKFRIKNLKNRTNNDYFALTKSVIIDKQVVTLKLILAGIHSAGINKDAVDAIDNIKLGTYSCKIWVDIFLSNIRSREKQCFSISSQCPVRKVMFQSGSSNCSTVDNFKTPLAS